MDATFRYVNVKSLSRALTDQALKVEYAVKAVENGGTCVGIWCKDGVVLAVEKIITSKLLKPGANKRIATVDRNVGIVCYVLLTLRLI